MVSHSQKVDFLYKDYLFWTWYEIEDKTLAFRPHNIITPILFGKEVGELIEDDLNVVSDRYFTWIMPLYRNQLNCWFQVVYIQTLTLT